MKRGRYILFDGLIQINELYSIRNNTSVYFKEDEEHFKEWSGWITVEAAQSKLIRALI
jgi:hypothetical protein